MTEQGIIDVSEILMATYPNYHPEVAKIVKVWKSVLNGFDDTQVKKAVEMYIISDTTGFAPSVGQIVGNIHSMTELPKLNGNEAWSLVLKAIKNGTYGSVEEYEKLPRAVQKAVGTPEQIKWWATDEDFNEGVEKSHFMKCYEAEVKMEREYERLPEREKKVRMELYQKSEKMMTEKQRQISQAISG